ncbi:ferredoxin [Pseudarthrobacter sp. P1]|uniref:ferredoxin n=1 Tax=Pseudarthrobacter sp. P1 TaxID=3418418 RepID=UPI003CECB26B
MTGRGGAAFAAWRKLAATGGAAGSAAGTAGRGRRRGPVAVVANGAEGEPGSFKDRTLLQNAPHLVIDGLLAAAAALAASALYVYTNAENLPAVSAALAERPDARGIRLVEAPETFVAGEASAVVRAVGGGPALPRDKTARMSQSGVRGGPTLVHNVETLAHIGLIARFGALWFRLLGTDADPGTRLVTVCGDVPQPRVYEIAGGTPLRDVLGTAGAAANSAVLVGGFHGRWVHPGELRLSPAGTDLDAAHPGAGVLQVLGPGRCPPGRALQRHRPEAPVTAGRPAGLLHIDWTACEGRGLCAELLPGVLARDEWGYPVARGADPGERTDVPLVWEELDGARDAVALCPRLALALKRLP